MKLLDGSDFDFLEFCKALEGRNLQAVWWSTESMAETYCLREKHFFMLFEKLLEDNLIKLAKKGVFLNGTVAEQIERFRQSFPKTEAEMEDGLWFFDETCPGGAVWVLEDGSLEWT